MDDTNFRVYREGSRYTKNAHWYSVAGDIEELKALAKKLEDVDGTQAARRLAGKITNAVPTFEASEEVRLHQPTQPADARQCANDLKQKRRKREYRQFRRAAFTRPEPGFSLYEGRTRGKRMRYTYDEDDNDGDDGTTFDSDATSTRRSTRQSGRNTPAESAGPTFTASGRQIHKPKTGEYGESLLRGAPENATDELSPEFQEREEDSEPVRGGRRAAKQAVNGESNPRKRKHIDGYNDIDDMSDEEGDAEASGEDWDSEKNDAENTEMPDADDEDEEPSEDDGPEDDEEPRSLVVTLRMSPKSLLKCDAPTNTKPGMDGETAPEAGVPGHDTTQASAGAPKSKPEPSALPNGVSHGYASAASVDQPFLSTPPSTASAYPTPASGSFPAGDAKPVEQANPPAHIVVQHAVAQSNGVGAAHEAMVE